MCPMNATTRFNCKLAKQLQDDVMHTYNRGLSQKFSDHSQGLIPTLITLLRLWLIDKLLTHLLELTKMNPLPHRYRAISQSACYIRSCLTF